MTTNDIFTTLRDGLIMRRSSEKMMSIFGKAVRKEFPDYNAAEKSTELAEVFRQAHLAAGKKCYSNYKKRLLARWAFPGVMSVDDGRWYKLDPNGHSVFDKERTNQEKLLKRGENNVAGGERLTSSGKLYLQARATIEALRVELAESKSLRMAAEARAADLEARLATAEAKLA
jgi:hypothetical protein